MKLFLETSHAKLCCSVVFPTTVMIFAGLAVYSNSSDGSSPSTIPAEDQSPSLSNTLSILIVAESSGARNILLSSVYLADSSNSIEMMVASNSICGALAVCWSQLQNIRIQRIAPIENSLISIKMT